LVGLVSGRRADPVRAPGRSGHRRAPVAQQGFQLAGNPRTPGRGPASGLGREFWYISEVVAAFQQAGIRLSAWTPRRSRSSATSTPPARSTARKLFRSRPVSKTARPQRGQGAPERGARSGPQHRLGVRGDRHDTGEFAVQTLRQWRTTTWPTLTIATRLV